MDRLPSNSPSQPPQNPLFPFDEENPAPSSNSAPQGATSQAASGANASAAASVASAPSDEVDADPAADDNSLRSRSSASSDGSEGHRNRSMMVADLLGMAFMAGASSDGLSTLTAQQADNNRADEGGDDGSEGSHRSAPAARLSALFADGARTTPRSIRLVFNNNSDDDNAMMVIFPPGARFNGDSNLSVNSDAEGGAERALGVIFSQAAARTGPFRNLPSAIQFWHEAAAMDNQTNSGTGSDIVIPTRDREQTDNLVRFLQRLSDTAEYRNANARPALAYRVVQMLQSLWINSRFRENALPYIDQANERCDDRVILMLNHVELMLRIQEAEEDPDPKTALRQLAIGLMKLESVHRSAEMCCTRRQTQGATSVDEVEVYLTFETRLADHLQLPISTRNMFFERFAGVSDTEIEFAAFEAESVVNELGAVERYLEQWEPWNRLHRQEAADGVGWQQIPENSRLPDFEGRCPITMLEYGELTEPVAVADRSTAMDFDSLMQWWVDHGVDPATQQRFALQDLSRFRLGLEPQPQQESRPQSQPQPQLQPQNSEVAADLDVEAANGSVVIETGGAGSVPDPVTPEQRGSDQRAGDQSESADMVVDETDDSIFALDD